MRPAVGLAEGRPRRGVPRRGYGLWPVGGRRSGPSPGAARRR
ncbi:hypothetical protein V2I01_26255 [Micromonospora sp. BRA006-A]|nr:hypothetical protein [Micromonospora sp. BRA006-A]